MASPRRVALRSVDLTVASFVGPRLYRDTEQQVLCAVCGKERAMWAHRLKRSTDVVLLCFGCGGH